MPWARASSLDRLVFCAGSAWQRREGDEDKSLTTELAADWGRSVHDWKATGRFTGPHADGLRARVHRLTLDREELYPPGTHETARAWNSVTRASGAMALGTEEERDAWKLAFNDEWSTGTSDYEGDHLGLLWVDDLKTGNTDPRFPPRMPGRSAQVRWYALAASRHRLYRGDVAVSITHWPRPSNPATLAPRSLVRPRRYWDILTAAQIDDFERTLIRVRNEMLARGPLRPARETCKFCPSRKWCAEAWQE